MNTGDSSGVSPAIAVRNIVLIGLRGCGKTTVGQLLAACLGWAAVDTDECVTATAGRSIREIFTADGEAAFRELECRTIAEVVRHSRQVISVGGGAVLAECNRNALRSAGVCVWLNAPPEELHRRVQADPRTADTRPPLTDRDELDEVRDLFNARRPLYAALAQHVVETTGLSVERVVARILAVVAGPHTSPESR